MSANPHDIDCGQPSSQFKVYNAFQTHASFEDLKKSFTHYLPDIRVEVMNHLYFLRNEFSETNFHSKLCVSYVLYHVCYMLLVVL